MRAREAAVCERAGAELVTLERFDATESYPALGSDVARWRTPLTRRSSSASGAPRQVEPAVSDFLVAFLRLLDADGASAERLRVFEIGLLVRSRLRPRARHLRDVRRRRLRRAGAVRDDVPVDPDRGGAVCTACARGGRPLQPAVRAALIRLSRTPLEQATAEALPVDVNRDCREALLEIINHHVSGPLKTVEFIAKVARAGGQS